MEKMLKRDKGITVADLRGNRELRNDIVGNMHPNLVGEVTGIRGDISGISGNVTGIYGDVSGIIGEVTDIYGYITGIRGDATGISGDLDSCKITDADRVSGINLSLIHI